MTPQAIATRCLDSALGEIRVSLLLPEAGGANVRLRYRSEGPWLRCESHALGADSIQTLDLPCARSELGCA